MSRLLQLLAAVLLLSSSPARGETIFVQDATETTITGVVYPWSQSSACECCVCWETTIGTVMSYWDDFQDQGGQGPWDQLMPYGDRFDEASFDQLTDWIWAAADIDCDEGGVSFWIFDDVLSSTRQVVNSFLGYDFSLDLDEWVWWGQDVEDEIRADRPIYYRFRDTSSVEPEGWQESDGHAITVVGVETEAEILYVYGNWDEILSHKGFDDANDHGTVNIEPGGYDCDVGSHVPEPTACGVGACAAEGRIECVGGFFSDTCVPGAPASSDSTCDGVDDDCDGIADEDHVGAPTICGVGACASTGHMVCSSGSEHDDCAPGEPRPSDETCDGVDDDCDGTADEDGTCGPATPDGGTPDPDGGPPLPDGSPGSSDEGGCSCAAANAPEGARWARFVLALL